MIDVNQAEAAKSIDLDSFTSRKARKERDNQEMFAKLEAVWLCSGCYSEARSRLALLRLLLGSSKPGSDWTIALIGFTTITSSALSSSTTSSSRSSSLTVSVKYSAARGSCMAASHPLAERV